MYKRQLHLSGKCLDCGAGIGRVTKHLLSRIFDTVDLLEVNQLFLQHAKQVNLKDLDIGAYHCASLHEFHFTSFYDCIWIQWVSSQLYNEDYVLFLQRCQQALLPKGVIIIKENILRSEEEEDVAMDYEDYSFTRTDKGFKALFAKAKLQVIQQGLQTHWPMDLFPVKMYALQ